MFRKLKPGVRVRVTARNRMPGYRAGDKGTVTAGPITVTGGKKPYFIVAMERHPDGIRATFHAGEIEPVV
jgi:hypothetical protein